MQHKVLFVDDDINILRAFKRQLRKQFLIETSTDPIRGLTLVAEEGPFPVVVSDYRMPGMDGNSFLERVKAISPATVRMLLTGHADLPTAMGAINRGNIFRLLTKPCPPEILEEAISDGIESWRIRSRGLSVDAPAKRDRQPKTLLAVDDDPGIRALLRTAFGREEGIRIMTADTGRNALRLLEKRRIDLVITDLAMPDVSGLKLLAHMIRQCPHIPAIVLTGRGTAEIESRIRHIDGYRYFEKPMDMSLLVEVAYESLAAAAANQIRGIGMSAFLQMAGTEKKTCRLTIRSDDRTGHLVMQRGQLVAARAGDLRAEDAAVAIINWEHPIIEMQHMGPTRQKEIHKPLMTLLVESARLKDEMAA